MLVDEGRSCSGPDVAHRVRGARPPVRPASPLHAQESPGPTGWEPRGLPALNYDSDEGFGYGVLLELYNYGDGGYSPYRFTIQPTVFLTTGGRRDFNLFFDAPHLLPEGWRIDALLRSERQFSIPYYGLGNYSLFDPRKEDMEGQYYYRFGGTRRRASVNIQRTLGDTPLRVLAGLGATRTKIDPLPKDAITTLLNEVIENAISGSIPETIPGGVVESRAGRPRLGYTRSGDGPSPWNLVGGACPSGAGVSGERVRVCSVDAGGSALRAPRRQAHVREPMHRPGLVR